jgi:hypothetical protein
MNRPVSANAGAVTMQFDAADRLHEIATSGGGARRFLYNPGSGSGAGLRI